jgi:hypothetical protein
LFEVHINTSDFAIYGVIHTRWAPNCEWKHTKGDQDYCHTVIFLRIPCLNFNHGIIMKDFHNFLHIMVGQNPNKSNSENTILFNVIWCDVKIYLCQKYIHHNVLKNENIFKKWFKWFLVFMKLITILFCSNLFLD